MEYVKSFKHAGLMVRIAYDSDPEDPREWDNLGTMICWHNRHNLGDEHIHADSESFMLSLLSDKDATRLESLRDKLHERAYQATKQAGLSYGSDGHLSRSRAADSEYNARLMAEVEKVAILLPLYLYDHSGITMRCHSFACPWDSGQVGWIYAPLEKVRKEYSCKAVTTKIRAKVITALESEVSAYDEYLTGQVYGFIIEAPTQDDDENGESLDSCWGFYGLEYVIEEAKGSADYQARERESLDAANADRD